MNEHHILDASKYDTFLGAPSFSASHRIKRVAYMLIWLLLARWTPPALRRWRVTVLRLCGARVDPRASVYSSARIWYPPNLSMDAYATLGPGVNCYNVARLHVGERGVVSQGAHLCAAGHDVDAPNFQLIARPITICARAWVAAEAFVGPGVEIGQGAVLGARGVAFKNLEEGMIYAGNPARLLRARRGLDDCP